MPITSPDGRWCADLRIRCPRLASLLIGSCHARDGDGYVLVTVGGRFTVLWRVDPDAQRRR